MTEKKKLTFLIALSLTALIGVGLWGVTTVYRSTEEVVVAHVRDKERVCSGEGDCKYLVYTDQGTFENTDSLFLYGKTNSADVQGFLQVGETYELTVVGWRWSLVSSFKNIVAVEEFNPAAAYVPHGVLA
jgi:hypothetical protein